MAEKLFPTTRLEAFSDGVLAVVITIMVLELKVPHQDGLAGLVSISPILFIYLLSFMFISIYWANHHHLLRRVERCDHRVLYANMGFLFSASLLPFFTGYVIEKHSDSFSVALYASAMIFTGFCFYLLRLAIDRLLRQTGDLKPEDAATQRKHIASLALYIAAVPLAHFHSYIALGVITLVAVIWIIPTARTDHYVPEDPSRIREN
jgi:TMEM175 potassium channel family protein